MTKTYSTRSTSRHSATVDGDHVLSDGVTTRRVVRAELVDNPGNPAAGVRATLLHQRKSAKGEWEPTEAIDLNTLKAGEGVRLHLDSSETLALARYLYDFYVIRAQGLPRGKGTVVIADEDVAPLVKKILESGHGTELFAILAENEPALLARLCDEQVQERRRKALTTFHDNIGAGKPEGFWQTFFETNTWIFGYGLRYQFLHRLQEQPTYGGTNVTGRGAERGDHLYSTQGAVRFTVLVDIKRPDTPLLAPNQYRNGAWPASSDLAGGVAQLQGNCDTWQVEGAETRGNRESLEAAGIFTHQPKGILVIGNATEFEGHFARRRSSNRARAERD